MLGIVIIGRNEGERLRRCLQSIDTAGRLQTVSRVVYVDSGSSDSSVELAQKMGATIVELDLSTKFTAARARNAGYRALRTAAPEMDFVHFVDGDCELQPGWLETAVDFLTNNAHAAVVCGRRRERFPEKTVYNSLCDQEWDTPIGKAQSCGGDALMRAAAFDQVNGFDDGMIAGEEPELCVRLRKARWEIWRIDHEMTLHDADMTHFRQWWQRNVRAGHAYAEGNFKHCAPPERFWQKELRSNWFWGLAWFLPFLWPLHAVLAFKIQRYRKSIGDDSSSAWRYARFVVLGKLPQMLGQIKYYKNRILGKSNSLIEYKIILIDTFQ